MILKSHVQLILIYTVTLSLQLIKQWVKWASPNTCVIEDMNIKIAKQNSQDSFIYYLALFIYKKSHNIE